MWVFCRQNILSKFPSFFLHNKKNCAQKIGIDKLPVLENYVFKYNRHRHRFICQNIFDYVFLPHRAEYISHLAVRRLRKFHLYRC